MRAAYYDQVAIAAMLIERGAKVDYQRWYDNLTPLMIAALVGPKVLRLLLEKGAKTELTTIYGQKALNVAVFGLPRVKYGPNLATTKILLDHGALPFIDEKKWGKITDPAIFRLIQDAQEAKKKKRLLLFSLRVPHEILH